MTSPSSSFPITTRPFPRQNGIPALQSYPGSGQLWLESLMNRKYRITITDGRQFHGDLQCTDNQKNLVISNTQEYRPPYANEATSPDKLNESGLIKNRFLGLAVIPGRMIAKVEVVVPRESPFPRMSSPAWGMR